MKIWIPDRMYKMFPMCVGVIGCVGCSLGSPATVGLGGVLLLYSGGVFLMRK
jgi:hypothetical protein